MMSGARIDRRAFLKGAAMVLPSALASSSSAQQPQPFTFAYVSDSHIHHIGGVEFVRDWDRRLARAVAEINALAARPDFVIFGGDLAQLGAKVELDHGAELLGALRCEYRCVMGEHDYYLDLGQHWSELFGPQYYSFDHKGVHFVVLNSILTYDEWTRSRWPNPEQRMLEMAGLDNPNGSPFMVGREQLSWLSHDLSCVSRERPIVVLSHSPLRRDYARWNFWTEDAEELWGMLQPFELVSVIHGHVHQAQWNRGGGIRFHSGMATSWPWPHLPAVGRVRGERVGATGLMGCEAPLVGRDATGWQLVTVASGHITVDYRVADK